MRLKSHDYFPSKSNTQYIYSSQKNKFLNFIKYEEFNSDSKIQLRYKSDTNSIVNLYEYDSLGVKQIFSKENSTSRINYLDIPAKTTNYLIKEPIVLGNTWLLSDGSTRSITSIDSTINTPYKSFKSVLEITTLFKDKNMTIDYYVEDVGLIKSIYFISNIGLFQCSLENIIENTSLSENITLYFPDKNLNSIWFTERNINFYSNDITLVNIENEFNNPPNGLLPLINNNILINNINFYEKNQNISIDFSKNILENTNLIYRNLAIQSLYNIISNYYKTKEVTFTIDGNILIFPFSKDISSLKPIINNKTILKWRISDCKLPLTYVVKENDTLIEIAKYFDTTVSRLSKLNNIQNPNIINEGDILQIYSCGIYTVKPQDTLEEICDKFYLTYDELAKLNKVHTLENLTPGQTLKLY